MFIHFSGGEDGEGLPLRLSLQGVFGLYILLGAEAVKFLSSGAGKPNPEHISKIAVGKGWGEEREEGGLRAAEIYSQGL